MKLSAMRILSIATVVVFLGGSAAAFISPAAFNQLGIQSQVISNSQTFDSAGGTITYFGNQFIWSAAGHLDLKVSPNGPGQWYNGSTGAYVVSVPSNSNANFIQSIVPSVTVTQIKTFSDTDVLGATTSPTGYAATNSITYTEKVLYTPYSYTGNFYGQSVQIGNSFTSAAQGVNTPSLGLLGVQNPFILPSYNANQNASNHFNSQTGILTFVVTASLNLGDAFGTFPNHNLTMKAQIYIVPGTGSINPPDNVQINHQATITGSISYGTYKLLITAPDGQQSTISIGQSSSLSKSFTEHYTPSQMGKYTVELLNTVVGLTETQFFSASVLLPTPQVIINTNSTASGYYEQGQTVSYTFSLKYNSTLPLNFEIYIWVGAKSSEPVQSSGNFITYGKLVKANLSNGIYQYTGSFVIPANGKAAGAVSIEGYAYYKNSTSLVVSQAPAIAQIQVGSTNHVVKPTPSFEIGKFLVALGAVIAGGLIAYFDRDTMNMRLLVFGSAVIFALIYYGGALL